MFNSIALDVVIGLIFIYLLYSLLATVLAEIFATQMGIRARNLKEAVNRMLTDEEKKKNIFLEFIDSLWFWKSPKGAITDLFYNHPEIKYLGSSGLFNLPSAFKAVSFSKTLLYLLFGYEQVDPDKIGNRLKSLVDESVVKYKNGQKAKVGNDPVKPIDPGKVDVNPERPSDTIPELDKDTAQYLYMMWLDSHGDVTKFKLHLEGWFDRTMEQATEWYKRKIQVILLILGFFLAWFFNADTFVIVGKLSNDKEARAQMVSMANAYVQNNQPLIDAIRNQTAQGHVEASKKLDSLLNIKKSLDADINKANSLLGLGSWLPDEVTVQRNKTTGALIYIPDVDEASLPHARINAHNKMHFDSCDKWSYFFALLGHHFPGFLVTAIAISLGAPFWFDLLNKLMKLRTSVKQDSTSPNSSAESPESPLNREA